IIGPAVAALAPPREALRRLRNRFLGYVVFISYRQEDGLAYAKALEDDLTRHNYTCFRDEGKIPVGAELNEPIEGASAKSRLLVVVGPGWSVARRWVRKEGEKYPALRGRKKWNIVPVESVDDAGKGLGHMRPEGDTLELRVPGKARREARPAKAVEK